MSAETGRRHRRDRRSRPRAVVFAVVPGGHGEPGEDEPLNEIKELLRSADMDWVADVIQHRDTPDPRTYLGKGKMAELKATIAETGATVAVCEDDLTPAQVAAVLDAVDVDVLDRTELILTVFSKHAHSLEGTLQVHLAQLEYELTRMRGKGLVMTRLGAGVDMRGPGETKLEVDRRVVRKRIQTLRRRIEQMARTRRTQRARRLRAGVPLIALAGYTNAGKSTLLNALTDAEVSVRDRLFETLDPTSRTLPLPRPRLRAHRHGRLHPQAAAPARRRVRQHARGDHARRRRARGRRRQPRGRPRSPCASRPWPRCST